MSHDHTLYRFFDANRVLLYVGRSVNPWRRFSEHRGDKPWWEEVSTITMQKFATADALADAEVRAIKAENPRHNKTHNAQRGITIVDYLRSDVQHMEPLPIGAHVALGMSDGSCPVGRVERSDDRWVTLQLKDWISGYYWGATRTYRVDGVMTIVYAHDDGNTIWDDDLAKFQNQWGKR